MACIVLLVSADSVQKLANVVDKGSCLEEIYCKALYHIENEKGSFEESQEKLLPNCPEILEEEVGIKIDVYASSDETYADLKQFCGTE